MQILPNEWKGTGEVAGIIFNLLRREGDLCIVSRSDRGFEVGMVRKQKATTLNRGGVSVDLIAKEYWPKGNAWGKHEYFTKSKDKAEYWFKFEQNRIQTEKRGAKKKEDQDA